MNEKICGILIAGLILAGGIGSASAVSPTASVQTSANINSVLGLNVNTDAVNFDVSDFQTDVAGDRSLTVYNTGNVPETVYAATGHDISNVLYKLDGITLGSDPTVVNSNIDIGGEATYNPFINVGNQVQAQNIVNSIEFSGVAS